MKLLSSMLFFHLEVGDTFETRVTMLLVNLLRISGTYFKTYYIMCSLADVGVLRDIQPQCSTGTWHDVGLKLLVNWRTNLCLAAWDYGSWDYHDSTNRSTCGSRQDSRRSRRFEDPQWRNRSFPENPDPSYANTRPPWFWHHMRFEGFLGLYGLVMANFIGTSDYQIFVLSKQMRYLPYKFYSPLLPKFSDQKNATHFCWL